MSIPAGSEASIVQARRELPGRLREVRVRRFGEQGGPVLARRLGIPARSWANFEAGVTIPGEVLLAFISQTGAEPRWLLDGEGPCVRSAGDELAAGTVEGGPDGLG